MNLEIMTLQEVAEYLKLSERTIYGYAQRGVLPGIKIGSAWRFRKTDLDAWIENQRKLTEESTSNRNDKKKENP
ncbi:MAG: helix-turn-helix domain-containing protein [Verrucomicrobiae bacterium]|nr:helix-turn-helix domain-containing protein [Verrucomicrobiae bacterium]